MEDWSKILEKEMLSEQEWDRLAQEGSRKVKFELLKRRDCPEAVLEKLLEEFSQVRQDDSWELMLQTQPQCPVSVLEELDKLSGDQQWEVREKVASYPLPSVSVVEELSLDPNSLFRKRIAEHQNCRERLLKRLIQDEEIKVVQAVLQRESLTLEVLEAGFKGKHKECVQQWMRTNRPKWLSKIGNEKDKERE